MTVRGVIMRLKSLQLLGFKSFVDKTEFNLEKGITCIVGPNGCGKSNIVDAIKWGLGEMRPKSLRGEDMEDVVFNGSEVRKPSGMAEVSLTFTSDGKGMPPGYADYDEIMITRRVFRTGESEYFINKVPVRWRDVIDLFLDTGVGPRAYSIIEQGVVEKIIMAKPDERRLFFEEVAGISKYRVRKKEALADMEATQQNLQRVEDVMGELKRQISSLDRQAKKAQKYRELMNELRESEFKLLLLQYKKTLAELQAMENELTQCKDKEIALNSEISVLQTDYDRAKIAIVEAEKKFNEVNEKYYKLQSEIQRKDNEINLLKKDISNAEVNKNNLIAEISILETEKNKLIEEKKTHEKMLDELKTEYQKREQQEQEIVSQYNEMQNRASKLKQDIDLLRTRITDARSEEARLKNELVAIEKDIDDRSRRTERLNSEIMEIKQKLGTADAGLQRFKQTREATTTEINILQDSINKSKKRLTELRNEYDTKMSEFQKTNEQVLDLKSRYRTQKEIVDNYEEFSKGVKTIMERQRSAGGEIKYRTVADIITIDEQYIKSLEAVLGEKLQFIVADDTPLCFEALEHLKATSGGRATFLPAGRPDAGIVPVQSDQRGNSEINLENNADIKPILGLVRYDMAYEKVINLLLKDVFLVEDVKRARELWSRPDNKFTYVTLDGDVFMPEGIFAGGSNEVLEDGILKRREELVKMQSEIERDENMLKNVQENLNSIQNEIAREEEILVQNEALLREKEISLLNTNNELKSITEDIENYMRSIEAKEAEKSMLEYDLKQFNSMHIENMKNFELNEKTIRDLEASLHLAVEEDKNIDIKIAQLSADLMKIKAEVASHKEKIKATESFCYSTEERINDVTEKILNKNKEIESLTNFRIESENKLQEMESLLKNDINNNILLEDEVKKVREEYDNFTAECARVEKVLTEKRTELEQVKDRLSSLNISISEHRLASEFLRSSANDKCQKDLDEFKDTELTDLPDELEAKVNDLQERVNAMGEINLVAAEEYKELTERFNFLNSQKEDLTKSLNNLKEAINKINKTSREKFIETFQAINAKFKEIFPKFFDGGRAELYLTNEHEVLESGIEVFAQPPGKKLQNISLLSGGEKALTGIALIFSFFLNKPSPFCILDEADAPLDEANLRRFLTMVKELNKDIQFIMITHNKLSMELGDALYGITMEEPGVSKVISVKLN
jgi:chromosome segregation protein